jgi:hypothetical protein
MGILDDITKHMKKIRRTWDFNSLKEEALKYSSKKDFFKGSNSAYHAAKKLDIFEEITSHMPNRSTRSDVWNEEKIKEEALKYNSKSKFKKGNESAYVAAKRLGVFEITCKHMPNHVRRTNRIWTPEKLAKEALKYSTKNDFRIGNKSAYSTSKKLGIFEEITSHMPIRAKMKKS